MKNKIILLISYLIFLLTLSFLLIVYLSEKPLIIKIKDINKDVINKKIEISGKIEYIKSYNDFQIIRINNHNEKIKVLVYKNLNLSKNDSIRVIGTVKEYNNTYEINAEKIFFNLVFIFFRCIKQR